MLPCHSLEVLGDACTQIGAAQCLIQDLGRGCAKNSVSTQKLEQFC